MKNTEPPPADGSAAGDTGDGCRGGRSAGGCGNDLFFYLYEYPDGSLVETDLPFEYPTEEAP